MRPTVVLRSATRILVVYTAYAGAGLAHDDVPDANAASLRSTYAALQDKLSHNQFERPLYLDSRENEGELRGEVYAIVEYSFPTVNADLRAPNHWWIATKRLRWTAAGGRSPSSCFWAPSARNRSLCPTASGRHP